jgi:hypothetical protein
MLRAMREDVSKAISDLETLLVEKGAKAKVVPEEQMKESLGKAATFGTKPKGNGAKSIWKRMASKLKKLFCLTSNV